MNNAIKAYSAQNAQSDLAPFSFTQRALQNDEVLVDILYCGVCHSDIHQTRNEWGGSMYPMVPGHEIVGRVKAVGKQVKNFTLGEIVGIGCLVDACHHCAHCDAHEEQFCNDAVFTYNTLDKHTQPQRPTFGGYAQQIIAQQAMVLKIGENLQKNLAAATPLLCAGITTYSPLKAWNVKKGTKVAVLGLGGLGHMAVKLAAAMGAEVTVLSTSPSKKADAQRLGAQHFYLVNDSATFDTLANHFDIIINTVSANIDYNPYLFLLKVKGVMLLLGIQPSPSTVMALPLVMGKRIITGSLIGGIQETQEMLDFCNQHNIFSDIEMIAMHQINEAYDRTLKSDVKYRFVIDIQNSLK